MGRALRQPLPAYPEQARQLGVQGSVFVRGVIAADGKVKRLHVLEGDPVLAQPVVDALNNWQYETTYLDRIPIELETVEEVKFSLDKAPQVSTPLHLSDGIVRGRVISQPLPEYPKQARKLGVQSVIVRYVIAADGRVKQLHVLKGNPVLVQPTLEAVSKWRFEPSYLNHLPIELEALVVVNFRPEKE